MEGTSGIDVITVTIHVPAKPSGRHFWNWISFPTGNVPFGHVWGGVQNSSGIVKRSKMQ